MAQQRILVNTAAVLSRTFAPDGDPTDADGAVTITGVDEAGASVFNTTATSNGSGNYSYTLTPQSALKRITVTWSGTWSGLAASVVDYVEIVGAHIFTETEARAFHDAAMANTSTYTDADIAEARDRITDQFERLIGTSPVPRYEREEVPGNGDHELALRKYRVLSVISATVNGTSVDTSTIKVAYERNNTITRTSGIWSPATRSNPRNCVIEYSYGHDSPPLELTRAALIVLRNQLVESNIGDRVVSLTDEVGTMRLAQPGFRGAYYGLPTVDAILAEYDERVPIL